MKKILVLMVWVALVSPSFAQEKTEETPDQALQKAMLEPKAEVPPVLEKLRGSSRKLDFDFIGKRYGVDTWLLSGPGIMQLVYVTEGAKSVIVGGALVGPDAKEQSAALLQEFMKSHPQRSQEILASVRAAEVQKKVAEATRAKMSPSEKLWADLAQAGHITYGNAADKPEIYVVMDPAMASSKTLWDYLWPLAKDNALTLHAVPLALTTGDSILQIASVLGHKQPQKAWEDVMAGREIAADQAPDASGALKMKKTVELAEKLKLRRLPFFVYRVPAGPGQWGKVRILHGMPKDWDKFLRELGVLPAAPKF